MTHRQTQTPGQQPAASRGSAAREPQVSSEGSPGRRSAASTPADSSPQPEPGPDGRHDLQLPGYYLNRELTWLNFTFRVLHEAEDPRTPLLERLQFIAIVSSNIDEFFMKRIGGLKQQVGAGLHELTVDGQTPRQQIELCNQQVRQLEARKRSAFRTVLAELKLQGIVVSGCSELPAADKSVLRQHFIDNIYPLLTPQATDPAHPFPFVSNLSLNLLVSLHHPDNPQVSLARVKVPIGPGVPRLLKLKGRNTFVRMDSIIAHNLDILFPGMVIDGYSVFRVTRNANTELEEEHADDLLEMIETELRDRRFAPVVRLEVSERVERRHSGMLAAELGLEDDADVFEIAGMQGMHDLNEILSAVDMPELRRPAHHPVDHPELASERNIFHIIRDTGAILLHHPYQSFSTSVERFLKEARSDPKVRAIKMCLYRTSPGSKVINYLLDAARNGKQVAVVVELKAKFDEAANIQWASRLEGVGIHVTYGVVGLKTHCKVVLVVRQDHDGLRRYSHIGTGNYHAGTARRYTDLGLLTCDVQIGADVTELFNYLTTGYKPRRQYKKLLIAPKGCKQSLLGKIDREVCNHSEESPGLIQIKMNALEDPEITRALYEASRKGVHIDCIVRDTCRLRPGIPGLSHNVRVVSIVGRFLEHSRIIYFRNGGEEEYYIGSADCMTRNLKNRVETLVPVDEPSLQAQLRAILDHQLADVRSAWEMRSDGSYVQLQPPNGKGKSAQQALIEWHGRREKKSQRLRTRKPRGPQKRES
jgi:polyphosphate kinase